MQGKAVGQPRRRAAPAAAPEIGKGKPIAAVERALQVLGAFRAAPRLTLSELSKRTGFYKSTLLRMLLTLEKHGYVSRLGAGEYRLGGVVLELGSSYQASFQLEEIIRPALETLASDTGESAAFYIRAGAGQRQCIFRVDSSQPVRAVIQPGQITRLDKAATGLVFAQHGKGRDRPADTARYAQLCVATSGVGDATTASVAAPIFGTAGFIGVMNVSGPVQRFTATSTAAIKARLAAVAAKVSLALGGVGPAG